jgi:hypothetical protein
MMWPPAYDSDRQGRPTASVAELTGMLDLSGWPKGIRVIVHERARPRRPAVQAAFHRRPRRPVPLRQRYQHGQFARLALRHCRCAAAKTRSSPAVKDIGLRNLPPRLHPDPDRVRARGHGLRTAGRDPVSGTGRHQHFRSLSPLLLPALKAPGFPGSRGRSTEQSLAVPIPPSRAGRIASRPSNHPGSY